MSDLRAIVDALAGGTMYDLGQTLDKTAPYHPNYPPFTMALQYRHGDWHAPCGMTFASELIVMTGHTGTHVDALGHCMSEHDARGVRADHAGLHGGSVDELSPVLTRGVLIDAAGAAGVDCLPDDAAVTAEDMRRICDAHALEVGPGDAVLIRTGRGRFWNEPARYFDPDGSAPGPDASACEWLAQRRVALAGSDTLTFERIDASMEGFGEGHLTLLGAGIPIVECLALEELAGAHAREFLFAMSPLKIAGGTGSPVRPIAVVPIQPEDRRRR
jgi:kynurenine formamidase